MRWQVPILFCLLTLSPAGMLRAQQESKPAATATSSPQEKKDSPSSEPQSAAPLLDPDTELRALVQQSAGDSAKLLQNLQSFLDKYPQTPRRVAIYRGMMQAAMQMNDPKTAIDFADKAIAIEPDDSQTLYLAASTLEKLPDEASQKRAIEYDTHLISVIAKANPETRPPQMSLEEWQAGRNKFTNELYVMRGRMERRLHQDDQAIKDLNIAFRIAPSSEAAVALGEISEQDKHTEEAVRQYALALILAGQDQDPDATANRNALRLRMTNLWRFTHDSSAGLGDIFLSAFDKNQQMIQDSSLADKPAPPEYNKNATDPLQFSMRQVDGKGAVKLADARGKIVILNFWTTWCAYCQTLEASLADLRSKFSEQSDVLSFAINADESETLVAPFLQSHKVGGTLIFADGVAPSLQVASIPTIIVLDRTGKIVYRTQGYAPDNFIESISSAIAKAQSAK